MATLPTKNIDGSMQRKHKAPRLEDKGTNGNVWSTLATKGVAHRIPMSFFNKISEPRKVDLQDLNVEEIRSLKKKDPFLYYSIPGARFARAALKDVDHSDINSLCQSVSNVSLGLDSTKGKEPMSTTFSRRTRVSFECHSSIIMEDLLDEFSDDEFSFLDDFDEDSFGDLPEDFPWP